MRELNLQTVADFTRYAIEHGIIHGRTLVLNPQLSLRQPPLQLLSANEQY